MLSMFKCPPNFTYSGICSTKDKIIVYIEHEKYRDELPDQIKGFKAEVKVVRGIEAHRLVSLRITLTLSK
ncbi:MAG: hypothetical protein DRJ31_07700 [Candidatus Methanomethylicota archaeon]|uniref:Uncharacterized protein n=1 Tax=Thermoproteota archaeon TaxID=2056631 RepID=A0A497EY68_9CREN|nr:MAG: hypothetical protein DRJ31_07700 [Candidatus Verstraetearchaeota archaeon]RLE51670.1 MAG: hypothetical protein DRJ33_05435 [Candidatus Verstraetearchaeota archaeon]